MILIDNEGRYFIPINIQAAEGHEAIRGSYYRELNTDPQWIYLVTPSGVLHGIERAHFPKLARDIAKIWLNTRQPLPAVTDMPHTFQYSLDEAVFTKDNLKTKPNNQFGQVVRRLVEYAKRAHNEGARHFVDVTQETPEGWRFSVVFFDSDKPPSPPVAESE